MITTTLRSLPVASLYDGGSTRAAALAAGLSEEQIDQVIARELAEHGNPSFTWFKAKFVGATLAVVMISFGAVLFWNGTPLAWQQVAVIFGAVAFGLWFNRMGARNEKLSALPAAVLRARAAQLTADQISVLKDHPALALDSDARALLETIRRTRSA